MAAVTGRTHTSSSSSSSNSSNSLVRGGRGGGGGGEIESKYEQQTGSANFDSDHCLSNNNK